MHPDWGIEVLQRDKTFLKYSWKKATLVCFLGHRSMHCYYLCCLQLLSVIILVCSYLLTNVEAINRYIAKWSEVYVDISRWPEQVPQHTRKSRGISCCVLWHLFGPPGNIDVDLRPFGNISIDGF